MSFRETLGAASIAVTLVAGSCSTEWSKEDVGCAAFVDEAKISADEGQLSVETVARMIYKCIPELPDEMVVSEEPGYGLTIDIPTRDGGSVYMSTMSPKVPKSAGLEAYAKNADYAFFAITNPGSNKVDSTIALGKRDENPPSVQWEATTPGPDGQPREQKITVGIENGPPRVVLSPEYLDNDLGDHANPKLVACIRSAVLQQVSQVTKTANTQNDTPKLGPLPLTDNCNGV